MKKYPSSVYRLQLNEKFPLKQATKLLPYLKKLGIDGVYCSPYFAAFSPHGYDIIDPNRINPLVATPKDYEAFCKALKKEGLYHLADIVPNHMGIRGENLWWQDVLLKGKKSKYAPFFDINWDHEKILIPLLDEPVEKQKITKVTRKGKPYLRYGELYFPIGKEEHYKLVSWLHAGKETSYRRFFNIGDLIGIRIEDPAVLAAHHQWVFELIKQKKIEGLRVDHPDGLYDPKEYFDRVRKKHKGLILVEKILGWGEKLPDWDVDGTVGYEYCNMLTGLFAKKGEKLTEVYKKFTGESTNLEKILYEKKLFYMKTEMDGDIDLLAKKISPKKEVKEALYHLLAAFPVYRSYIPPKGPVPAQDKPYWEEALAKAKKRSSILEKGLFKDRDALMRFQQLSAPIYAKGFEDITLYNYNRLLALNEVGSSPEKGGVTPEEFHSFCIDKQKTYPLGALATSTHDTKRSLDARMQIAVLSEIPNEWEKMLYALSDPSFPDKNAEYALFQNILGAWPSRPGFDRLWTVFLKSVREARVHTSWREPNLEYEMMCKDYLKSLLKRKKLLSPFQKKIQPYGEWKTLAATALHLASPGIVDLYQGCESYCYNLVDPDNRRPIDYTRPETLKTKLTRQALQLRLKHKKLFIEGEYIPLKTRGPNQDAVIAFMRKYQKQELIVAAPRFVVDVDFRGTEILVPGQKPLQTHKLFAKAPFAWII